MHPYKASKKSRQSSEEISKEPQHGYSSKKKTDSSCLRTYKIVLEDHGFFDVNLKPLERYGDKSARRKPISVWGLESSRPQGGAPS
jgi:hypothetical protein